jgi:uncharacterized protein YaiI (UPF0178 family)
MSGGHQGHPLPRGGAHEDPDDAGGEQAAAHAGVAVHSRAAGAAGIDVADSHIVRELSPGDLVVTADIPLAADVIAKEAHALNPRGEFYSTENIQERLALRNYLDELRGAGEPPGGPAALDNTDRKRFADQLDRFLAKRKP